MAGPSFDPTEQQDIPAGDGAPVAADSSGPASGRPPLAERTGAWFALRLLLAAGLVLAGLAVAAPSARGPGAAVETACAVPAAVDAAPGTVGYIVLPPGHPPIPGFGPGPAAVELPPGHPPIDGWHRGLAMPARPPSPIFTAPSTVDL